MRTQSRQMAGGADTTFGPCSILSTKDEDLPRSGEMVLHRSPRSRKGAVRAQLMPALRHTRASRHRHIDSYTVARAAAAATRMVALGGPNGMRFERRPVSEGATD